MVVLSDIFPYSKSSFTMGTKLFIDMIVNSLNISYDNEFIPTLNNFNVNKRAFFMDWRHISSLNEKLIFIICIISLVNFAFSFGDILFDLGIYFIKVHKNEKYELLKVLFFFKIGIILLKICILFSFTNSTKYNLRLFQ